MIPLYVCNILCCIHIKYTPNLKDVSRVINLSLCKWRYHLPVQSDAAAAAVDYDGDADDADEATVYAAVADARRIIIVIILKDLLIPNREIIGSVNALP